MLIYIYVRLTATESVYMSACANFIERFGVCVCVCAYTFYSQFRNFLYISDYYLLRLGN